MAKVSDITTTTKSGLNYIDALLDTGPDWNYLTPAGNTLKFTFSIASANEAGRTGLEAFNAAQQAATRSALSYISKLTGIRFVETAIGEDAQIHLSNMDVDGSNVAGLCSWRSTYTYDGTTLNTYDADAYVYLDSNEFRTQSQSPTTGSYGYQTLLHEIGHALGLKHPFSGSTTLPLDQDNTSNTLMSYTESGGPYSTFQQDDIAALNWLYGRDGLAGAAGLNSTGGVRYYTGTNGADSLNGTSYNDLLEGDGGNDVLTGGLGTDTAVFRNARNDYTITLQATGNLQVVSKSGLDGTDILRSIEFLRFADSTVSRDDALKVDVTPPTAPTLLVAKNANGYALGDSPLITGGAEAGAVVNVFDGDKQLIGTTQAGTDGLWTYQLAPLSDHLGYKVTATATDAAGNVSQASDILTFNIDSHAPTVPTAVLAYKTGDNQATISGMGEVGTDIKLVRTSDLADIASVTVGETGKWSVTTVALPDGAYEVAAVSVDGADNATSADEHLMFTVASKANQVGTAGNDKLLPTAGNNAIDGADGLDTVTYAGKRADYTLSKQLLGFGVNDNVGDGGQDTLLNVERVNFSDATIALDIDGVAGQAYRLYKAAFDRAPDKWGLGFWIWTMDDGTSLDNVSSQFLHQPEFDKLYGTNPTNEVFLTHLYSNVLHRTADGDGYAFWLQALRDGVERSHILMQFSESPENQAQLIGTIQDGIEYTPWAGQ